MTKVSLNMRELIIELVNVWIIVEMFYCTKEVENYISRMKIHRNKKAHL
jgi:hypothetical protein